MASKLLLHFTLCWIVLVWLSVNVLCDSNPCGCMHGGACGADNQTCTCLSGYTGSFCETVTDPCEVEPCQHGGTCTNTSSTTYHCSCPDGRTGTDCEALIDPCTSGPCQGNGTCSMVTSDTFTCVCAVGRTGMDCSIVIDPCTSGPCQGNGTCSMVTSDTYTCVCAAGRTGMDCSIIEENCPDQPCQNNGTCNKAENKCVCTSVTQGTYCNVGVPQCASNPCINSATCTETTIGNYNCTCPPGYAGTHCETRSSGCGIQPCVRGTCVYDGDTHVCDCPDTYVGTRCEKEGRVLRFRATLDVEWRRDYAVNSSALQSVTAKLTQQLEEEVCADDRCTVLTVAGACPWSGKTQVHYEVEVSSGLLAKEVQNKTEQLRSQDGFENLDGRGFSNVTFAENSDDTWVSDVTPDFGPVEGGTQVSVCGYNLDLGPSMVASFRHQSCNVVFRSVAYMECETTSLADTSLTNKALTLSLWMSPSNMRRQRASHFTYKPNPNVTSIHPLYTILRGGVVVTAEGTNLQAVARPKLTISTDINGTDVQFEQACIFNNETTLHCPTPALQIVSLSGDSSPVNGTFMVGLVLDGLTAYTRFTRLDVYPDPVLHQFSAGRHSTIVLRTYHPHNEKAIVIKGRGLRTVLQAADYSVRVGGDPCPVTHLTDTEIHCTPRDSAHGRLQVLVYIGAGRPPIPIGEVRFERSVLDNPGSRYAIISASIVALVIVGCAGGFCIHNHMLQSQREAALTRPKRNIVRSIGSKYHNKRKSRSFKQAVNNFLSEHPGDGGRRLFRPHKGVLGLNNSQSSAVSSESSTSTAPMPGHTRIYPNYEKAASPQAASGNIFLRHFSKFVSGKRLSTPRDPIYDVIAGDNPAFVDELDGVRLSAFIKDDVRLSTEVTSYCTKLPFPVVGETPIGGGGSIHPPSPHTEHRKPGESDVTGDAAPDAQ